MSGWCEESQCDVYRDLPGILLVKDLTLSWKTQAKLPRRGRFRKFKDMPTDLNGMLKLHWANTVGRMMIEESIVDRMARLKGMVTPVSPHQKPKARIIEEPPHRKPPHMRKLRNKRKREKA